MTTENQGETDSTSGGEEIFPGGIRVEQSRRRPLVGDEAEASGTPVTASSDSDDKPSLVVRHNEPRPAVPPSAGGAHRSAVYRTRRADAIRGACRGTCRGVGAGRHGGARRVRRTRNASRA